MLSVGLNPSEAEVHDMFNEVDTNGKGAINFSEFLTSMSNMLSAFGPLKEPNDTNDSIGEIFNIFDKDGDKCISAAELQHVFSCLGVKLTDKEVDEVFKIMDHDNDGVINYEGRLISYLPNHLTVVLVPCRFLCHVES